LEKKAIFELNAVVRMAGMLILALLLFAGCEEDGEGPTESISLAWDRHYPMLEGNKLHAVVFANVNEGWIVGMEGVILHTGDGGNNWSSQESGTKENLWDITFFDTDTGWAVGENGTGQYGTLLRTTNGGLVWEATQFDTISGDIYGVAFEDGQNGWAVGEIGTVVRTTDGGRSWKRWTSRTDEILRSAFSRSPSLEGNERNLWLLAVGDAGTVVRIWEDSDFVGQSLDTIDTNDLWAVTFVDSTGWAVGENGAIWHTTDDGVTWSEQTSHVSETLTDVVFTDALTGLIVGSGGTILSTSNGGETWAVDTSTTWHNLFGICHAGQAEAWAVGSLTILHSTNGGSSWSAEPSGTAPYTTLQDITFLNEDLGWAVGNAGTILKTADGGDTWEYQKRESVYNLADVWYYDVMFIDNLNGWCVGGRGEVSPSTGLLLHTSDGGRSWSAQSFDSTQCLYGITFVDTVTGWAVGGDWSGSHVNAIVLRTTDGGLNWEELTGNDLPTVNKLEAVTFVDALNGWVVGSKATILRTTDGGASWENKYAVFECNSWECTSWDVDIPSGDSTCVDSICVDSTALPTPTLYAVAAIGSSHCWAIGKQGAIMYTSDGGTTWDQQYSGTTEDLCAVTFISASTGWVIGDKGIILYTDNGGATWSIQPSGAIGTLLGVAFIDRDYGWIVGGDKEGNNIILLSTTTGGR